MSLNPTSHFTVEKSILEFLHLPPHKPEAIQLVDSHIIPTVLDYTFTEIQKGLSYEGQSLLGVILVIHLSFAEKLTYLGHTASDTFHSAHYASLRSVSIDLPPQIKKNNTLTLLKTGSFTIYPSIESISTKLLDARSIQQISFLRVTIVPH
ncbi:MAG: hypothetical protein ACRDDX_03150 [Cellulosilyticaceae bacterium]